jgi:hypothetical protein
MGQQEKVGGMDIYDIDRTTEKPNTLYGPTRVEKIVFFSQYGAFKV